MNRTSDSVDTRSAHQNGSIDALSRLLADLSTTITIQHPSSFVDQPLQQRVGGSVSEAQDQYNRTSYYASARYVGVSLSLSLSLSLFLCLTTILPSNSTH